MDFSAANTSLWSGIIQCGIIAAVLLFANILKRKISFIRLSLMPTAVLGGFVLLILRSVGLLDVSQVFLESVTYHALAIGFIAMSLRISSKSSESGAVIGSKSGALIVSTYLVQALVGLVISILLAYTVMPSLFKASGILLPMAYGQGPGQANNVGSTYESLGFTGGRSFGLSLAAAGYLCACIVGVIYLNVYDKKGKLKRLNNGDDISGSVTIDTFQDKNEIPIAESVDKLSIQATLVIIIYLITYLVTRGITGLISAVAPGLGDTVNTLLWGFNFIIGSLMATLCRIMFKGLRKVKLMNRQYQNNYLLNRISGLAFDVMIVAGIASINIEDLSGLWVPFILMAVAGGVITFWYLMHMCKKLYPGYVYEGFFSMYGMLTGTISSGILLLREIDPNFDTPAANNLITGSSFGIIFGIPMLILISIAASSTAMLYVSLGIIAVYLAVLIIFMNKFKSGKK